MAVADHEDLGGLERPEYAVWIRFLAAETAQTAAGDAAQERTVGLLNSARERGPWCDHEPCLKTRARLMERVVIGLWKTPSTG